MSAEKTHDVNHQFVEPWGLVRPCETLWDLIYTNKSHGYGQSMAMDRQAMDNPWPWTIHGHGHSMAMDSPWPWTIHGYGQPMAMDSQSMAMDNPWPWTLHRPPPQPMPSP